MKMRRSLALGVIVLACLPALASAADEPDLFAPRPAGADAFAPVALGVVRARPVAVDFQALPGADGVSALPRLGHTLRLNIFDDTVLSARVARAERLGRGLSVSGRLVDDPLSSVEIVVYDGIVSGTINGKAGNYRISWVGTGQVVQEMDYHQFPEAYDCALEIPGDFTTEVDLEPEAALDDGSLIDVMVVYTPAARVAQGGTSAMLSLINLAISETNTAYGNSSIVQRVRLVHAAEVSLTESDIGTDLERLTDTDGVIDNVHTLRETYKADMVSLFGEGYTSAGACGVAWLMSGNNPGFESHAFSVVDRTCATGYYSFGHEIGHNQGLNHARVDPVGAGAYDYSYGYKDPDEAFRTVMAYDCPGGCPRVSHFSNPTVFYGGKTTGISDTEPDSADNAKSLNNTRITVANWRTRSPAVTVTSPSGGETWLGGSVHAVTWSSFDLDPSASITLTYSDGTLTWPIASSIDRTATSYDWTVPNNPASGYRVTVCSEVSGACETEDSSDGTFAISSLLFPLLVSREGPGVGSVVSSPVGIDCGQDCSEDYPSGTPVTLTAVAGPGSTFAGWGGACSGMAPDCPLTVDGPKSVTALFDLIADPVAWERLIGTEVVGTTLRRPTGVGWDAGAVSDKVLVSGDGYAECQVTASTGYAMFGLSHEDTDGSYSDIDHAIYTYPATGQLMVFEKGVYRGVVGTYAVDDRLRVSVEGGFVTYRRNDELLYTSGEVPTYPLLVDTSLYSSGGEVFDAHLAGTLDQRTTMASTDILWRNAVRVTTEGSTLRRENGVGWIAGASSAQELISGDGYAEYRVSDPGSYIMFGLSHGDTDQGWADIDYAIYTYPPTGQVLVYEQGSYQATLGAYQVGDVLRVAVEGGVVVYSVDGVPLYTSSAPPTYPLLTDTSLYSSDAVLADARMGGDLREVVTWTHLTGLEAQGDALVRVEAGGWTAGAISSRRIASGSGSAEYVVADAGTYAMFGLSHGDSDGSYADIDHAIYTYAGSGHLLVYEGGVFRGAFGAYTVGDTLEVSVDDSQVSYWKNGGLLYSSTVPAQYPLVIDASVYEGRIEGARLSGNVSSVPIVEEAVQWANLVGVGDNGGTLERPSGIGWNAGAVSTQTLSGDGYVEFEVSATSSYLMFGLGNGDTDQGYADIEYAVYTYAATGQLLLFENGVYRGAGGTYAVGDRLRVAIEGGVVKYRKNGALLYSSTASPTYPLNVDTSLYSTGAAVATPRIGREE